MKNKFQIDLEPLGDLKVKDIYISAEGVMTVRGTLKANINVEAEYAIDINKDSPYFTME